MNEKMKGILEGFVVVLSHLLAAIKWVVIEVIVPTTVWMSGLVMRSLRSLISGDKSMRIAVATVFGMVFVGMIVTTFFLSSEVPQKPKKKGGDVTTPAPTPKRGKTKGVPSHILKIRKARAKLHSFSPTILPYATKQYNKQVSAKKWRRGAKNCLKYTKPFKLIAKSTGYPIAYVAGIALHESDGCRPGASDRAGGKSLMQITGPKERKYKVRTAALLGIDVSKLDYIHNIVHNVAFGIVIHDDYELQFGSRPHGLLAYNMGVGGVKKYVRRMGKSMKKLPTLAKMRPHLRYERRIKPRVYAEKVLASVAMMAKTFSGKPLVKVKSLRPSDVPGFYPGHDGTWPVTTTPGAKAELAVK